MYVLIFTIIVIAVIYQNRNNSKTKKRTTNPDGGQSRLEYGQRLNMYENAINQNRYHSITKLSRDYHLPAHLVMNDIKQMQQDGFLLNVKVEYNHDEIVYLDEQNRNQNQNQNQTGQYQESLSTRDTYEVQDAYTGQSVAYAKTRTRSQRYAQNTSSGERQPQLEPRETKQTVNKNVSSQKKPKTGNRNVMVDISTGVEIEGAQPEYQPDYFIPKAEYNFVAEYPDTSHIWDNINSDLFTEDENMIVCPKCGTKNIVVRNSTGECNCYFCQGNLM